MNYDRVEAWFLTYIVAGGHTQGMRQSLERLRIEDNALLENFVACKMTHGTYDSIETILKYPLDY